MLLIKRRKGWLVPADWWRR